MNYFTIIIAVFFLPFSFAWGCPTCVGRLKIADEPFFKKTFETTEDNSDAFKKLQEEFDLDQKEDESDEE